MSITTPSVNEQKRSRLIGAFIAAAEFVTVGPQMLVRDVQAFCKVAGKEFLLAQAMMAEYLTNVKTLACGSDHKTEGQFNRSCRMPAPA